MPTIVVAFFAIVISLLVASRLLAWLIQWQLSKRLKVGVKIGKVGLFTIRSVQVLFGNGVSVEIDQLWLSSCYVNQDVRKPIVLCAGDVRIQTDGGVSHDPEPPDPGGDTGQQTGEGTTATSRQTSLLNMITYLQFVGLRVENVTVMLLKTMVDDCLIHLTVQQVNLDISLHTDSFQLCGNLVSTSCKALRGSTGDQLTHQPCLAEASISTFVDLRIDREDVHRIKVLDVLVSKPQMMITEGMLNTLHIWKKGQRTPQDKAKGSKKGIADLPLLLPRDVSLTISELDVKIVRETKQRTLSVALKRFHTGLQSSDTGQSWPDITASVSVEDFLTQSPQARFAALNKLTVRLQTQPHRLEINTQLHSVYFHYHHDELQYWSNMVKHSSPGELTPPDDPPGVTVPVSGDGASWPSQESSVNPIGCKISSYLEGRRLTSVVEVMDTSFTMSSASCSGFNAGVAHTKFSCTFKPGLKEVSPSSWLQSHDAVCELEIQTVYACLCESQVALSDLTYKKHYWNYILNLTIVILKAKKLGKELTLEGMVDNIQGEWSTAALTTCLQLIGAVSKGKPAPVAVSLPATPIKPSLDLKQTLIDRNLLTVNFSLSNVNIFVCNDYKACIMLRVDSLGLELRQQQSVVQSCGMKLVYMQQSGKCCAIRKSVDISNPVAHVLEIRLTYKHREREANVQIMRRVFCLWHTSFHMCIQQLTQDLQQLRDILKGPSVVTEEVRTSIGEHERKSNREGRQPSLSINLILHADTYIGAQLSSSNRVAVKTEDVLLTATLPHVLAEIESVDIVFDDRNIISLKGVCISTLKPHHLKKEREATEGLLLPTNKAWCVSFNRFEVIFPYQYNFAACYEELINIWKWVKLVHRMKKKPFTGTSPLPPDLQIKIKSLLIQLSDDPFEVKLGDNYELLKDECAESEKRKSVMDQKIQSLRKTHALLPVSKVSELYTSLAKKSAEIYIQRSQKLYNQAAIRTKLLTWTVDHLNIIALADTSIHGTDNVVTAMRQIDPDSPYPEEGLEFTTLWCRMVSVKVRKWLLLLRDYPQPMMDISEMNIWGKLIGAEQAAAKRAKRSCTVEVGQPWGNISVERSMPPLKFFHDFSCDVSSFTMTYGAAWEPSTAHFNLGLDLVNKPSVDPSRPMPWWDKARLLFHGRLTMSLQRMSWLYHASLDPFNTTELMDWTWSNLVMDWTNAQFLLKGDLDIYARTASKYDDCRLLHLPNLRFCVRFEWLCLGDPNDHHAVMPCAPDKTPEYSLEEHDSFRAFRSQNLNLHLSLETKPSVKNPNNIPVCLFYASTLRFLDQIKLCIFNVTRPIKRGPLFNNAKPKKVQLSRHYKHVTLSMNFPQFSICYWMSFAHQHGAELLAESFTLESDYELSLVPIDDGLKHRHQASWSIRKLNSQLTEATVWLCSSHSESEEQVELNVSMRKPVDRSFFISIARVSYHRADESEQEMASDKGYDQIMPTHRVQVYDMRGAWIKSNRNVLFGLFDAFTKAKSLKRNLSSDALKGFKVDSTQQNMGKSRASSTASNPSNDVSPSAATPSPLSRLQTGHALSMLHKLVAETDSKSVAFTEEPSGSNMEQLHGVAACQTDSVIGKDWHIEIHNSQVVLKGVETPGYVIVSMACGQILSCTHQPIWRHGQLRSKKTWVGSVDCMQYYATVDPGHEFSNNNVSWLTMENVEDRSEQDLEGVPEMVGSGLSVGGVVSSTVGAKGEDTVDLGIQLQRVISRCKCQFFYASYGEVNPDSVPNVPLPPSEDSDVMMTKEEGVDTFTLLHHDLNISSNPMQYKMILDIVNNLLLYVEPKKKEAGEKLQSLKFQVLLAREDDQKTPILELQESVREHVQRFRRLEKSLYSVQKALDDNPGDTHLNEEIEELEAVLYECKAQMNILNEELTTRISCFKDSQLQVKTKPSAAQAAETQVTRRNEVCFKFAQWRLTQADGQLGIADLILRNFVYTKVNRDNDNWSHQLELGWVKMTNLLPNTIYKDVLVPLDPQMKEGENRQLTLRIHCSERPPVGGIAVKEHFEVNVIPMQIQLTYEFFKIMMGFFFPGKEIDTEDDEYHAEDGTAKKKPDKKHGGKEKGEKKATLPKVPSSSSVDDIDKMKERAAQNNTFVYIKIPEVPLRVSYKGEKDKNIEDVHDFSLVLPMMEYHDRIWTWFDLLIAMKNDSKRVLLSQAIKQKLHMRSRAGEEGPVTDVQQEEDKAKMLLGAKLLAGQDKPAKKSLFGKLQK